MHADFEEANFRDALAGGSANRQHAELMVVLAAVRVVHQAQRTNGEARHPVLMCEGSDRQAFCFPLDDHTTDPELAIVLIGLFLALAPDVQVGRPFLDLLMRKN